MELPSGFMCQLQPVGVSVFIQHARLPQTLTNLYQLENQTDQIEEPKEISESEVEEAESKFLDFKNDIVSAALYLPKVVETITDDNQITLDLINPFDYEFIYNRVVTGNGEIDRIIRIIEDRDRLLAIAMMAKNGGIRASRLIEIESEILALDFDLACSISLIENENKLDNIRIKEAARAIAFMVGKMLGGQELDFPDNNKQPNDEYW